MLSYDHCDTSAIRKNLKQARAAWDRISTIIAKEYVPPPVAGMFYQAVVAAVLLYGSESWVVSAYDLRALEGFHVEAARRLTGMRPKKRGGDMGLPEVGGHVVGGAVAHGPGDHRPAPPDRPPGNRGPAHFGGV